VLACTKPDFRKKPFSTIKKKAFVLECKSLWDNPVPSWISRRVKKDKYDIHSDAASMLAAYVGTSLREICNELEKLYIYLGDKKFISVDDVTAVVGVSKEFTIFELQWAIGAKDTRKATEILERMIEAGESPIMMVSMLTRFFQTLYKLHDVKRRGASGQQAYIQSGIFSFGERWVAAAAKFSIRDIEDAFLSLSEVDEKLKTSGGDQKLLMQTFIVNACLSVGTTQSHRAVLA
jgi:DNA polymerase-3 subunit delta